MTDARTIGAATPSPPRAGVEAFFSHGFRPFFLGASLYAAAAMAAWLAWIGTQAAGGPADWLPVAGSPYAWHAHEMAFGFGMAAVAGFLLTAVPNWTGARPLSGRPLMALFGVWLAGRVAMAVSGFLPSLFVAIADFAFVPLLAAFAARQFFVKLAPRNLVFLAILAAMVSANAAFHLAAGGVAGIDEMAAVRFMLTMLVLMIAIVGGRVTPAFTHNWLHLAAIPGPMPRRLPWLDAAAIASIAVFALLRITPAPDWFAGVAALAAGLLNGTRLALWRGIATWRAPIVWILHLGYAWLAAGLLLAGASALTDLVPASAASHAFGAGAVGTMTIGVMSRAALGHTGRPLAAPAPVVWAYMFVTLAAALRVAGPVLAPASASVFLAFAGLSWIAAFGLFVVYFTPILTAPRLRSKIDRATEPRAGRHVR